MNCVITGHTQGIGKAIFEKYGGIGLSRSKCINDVGYQFFICVNNDFYDTAKGLKI